ncbi:hypothetical protein [Azospirillum rugosum]|uniref:Uncharacterized protein n=1 Tax=Azospirillum rugosum TaxID=416170 RepID=A0ABS4STG2_9PROT|nr:hypothetical protein [Azospirillum rugosum]MBP2295252.1 hypothetical protein [Azospirillum rugosum]MDQ0528626.1 hypothetical protein [Azospirillum rugosum]
MGKSANDEVLGTGIPLGMLVRSTDEGPDDNRTESVVFDHGRKEVLPKQPWLSIGRSVKTYRVQTGVWTADRVVRCPLRVMRVPNTEPVMLYAAYALNCPPGKQDKVVTALLGDAGPSGDLIATWERRFFRYIEEFAEGQARTGRDLVLDFFDRRDEIIQHLVARVAGETGLTMRLHLQLDGETDLKKLSEVTIAGVSFNIRPKGLEGDLRAVIGGPLRVSEQHRGKALIRLLAAKEGEAGLRADVARDIKDVLQNFVSAELTIADFASAALTGTRQRLLGRLNEALRDRQGRVFDHIDFELPHPGGNPPELVQFELSTVIRPKDSQATLPIISNLSMQLENPGRFQAAAQRNAAVANPKEWLEAHVGQIVTGALFNSTYAELILSLDNERIRSPLAEKAMEIGYSVKHYSAIPEQPILKLKREGVRLVTGQEDFATRDTRVNVALDVAVSAEMPASLIDIERFIRPEVDLIEEMRHTVTESVRKVLHGITPEEFYTQFSSVDELPPAPKGPVDLLGAGSSPPRQRLKVPVEEQIRTAVEASLKQIFCLRAIHVVPKMADTVLTRRYRHLCSGIHTLDPFPVGSLTNGGRSSPVTFLISFKVSGMAPDGWTVFQSNSFDPYQSEAEINAIKSELAKSLHSSLSLLPPELLEYRTEREWSQVHEVARIAQKAIEQAFGLSITFVSFSRALSADESYERARREGALENALGELTTALADAKLNRAADTEDLETMRALLNQRLKEGMPPDDAEIAAYMKVIRERRQATSRVLAYEAPQRSTDPSATDVDILRHVSSVMDPGNRVLELAKERKARTGEEAKTGGTTANDAEAEPGNPTPN